MKKSKSSLSLLGIIGLASVLASCSPKSVIIKGKVTNAGGKPVVFCKTIDGIYTQSMDTLRLQADSTFVVTIPCKTPERFDFYLWGARKLSSVYLKPGTVELDIDASAEIPIKKEVSPEDKVMGILSELDGHVWDLRGRKADKWNIAKDTVASSVYGILTDYARTLEKELTGIDDAFKSKAVQDIRMQLLLAFENQFFVSSYRASELTKKEWIDAFRQMSDFADLNNPDNVFSPAFEDAIRNQIGITVFDIEKQTPSRDRNEFNQFMYDRYQKELQGRVCEVMIAKIILSDEQQEDNATGIPALYDNFLTLYPQSALKPLLDKAVAKNKAFNDVILSKDIHFLDTDSVKTFKEITDRFLGKVIFIDLWATWCGPCRESFSHVKPLQQYAKENDVILLYISIDRPTDKDKWMKMANFYDLKGEHVILNELFKQEIYDTFGKNGGLYIPHCAIVNKKGELQFPTAASPEDQDKLTAQLKEAAGTE